MIGSTRILAKANCPVIKDGYEVIVLFIWDFPNTNTKFVTIKDLHNVNLNHHGNPEPIISTIRLTDFTFEKED